MSPPLRSGSRENSGQFWLCGDDGIVGTRMTVNEVARFASGLEWRFAQSTAISGLRRDGTPRRSASPCGLLNVDGYYDSLLALFDHATAERFVTPTHRHMVIAATDPVLLVDQLLKIDVPVVDKWIDRSQT